MPTPSAGPAPGLDTLKIHVFGHSGADPEGIAHAIGAITGADTGQPCDLAIFSIHASDGIDPETIALWEALDESMVPRLITVVGIEGAQADFDDAVLIANRVFDQTVTPFLVLHDDTGLACALIDLVTMNIRDYSTLPPTVTDSEEEHKSLISAFRDEYREAIEIAGENGFAAGVLFPAIPIWLEKGIGVDVLREYITKIASEQSPGAS